MTRLVSLSASTCGAHMRRFSGNACSSTSGSPGPSPRSPCVIGPPLVRYSGIGFLPLTITACRHLVSGGAALAARRSSGAIDGSCFARRLLTLQRRRPAGQPTSALEWVAYAVTLLVSARRHHGGVGLDVRGGPGRRRAVRRAAVSGGAVHHRRGGARPVHGAEGHEKDARRGGGDRARAGPRVSLPDLGPPVHHADELGAHHRALRRLRAALG